jgi:hypothetical protein
MELQWREGESTEAVGVSGVGDDQDGYTVRPGAGGMGAGSRCVRLWMGAPNRATDRRQALPVLSQVVRVHFHSRDLGLLMLVDVGHGVADGADLLRVLVLDLEIEFLLERHDDLNEVQRVRVEIADELGFGDHLFIVDPETLSDDALNSLKYSCQPRSSSNVCETGAQAWGLSAYLNGASIGASAPAGRHDRSIAASFAEGDVWRLLHANRNDDTRTPVRAGRRNTWMRDRA